MTEKADVGRLLAEILADPASEAARLVYADHLVELGDPRGELVHIQCKLESIDWDAPQRRTLERRVGDLLAVHETAWTRDVRALGFDEYLEQARLRRGFVEAVRVDSATATELVPALRAITPLREIHVHAKATSGIDPLGAIACELEGLSLHTAAREIARAIAARIPHWPHRGKLRTLHVSGVDAAKAIAATPALRGLRHLRVIVPEPAGVLALALAPHLATIETLELPASAVGAEGIAALARADHLRDLRRLQIEGARLGSRDLEPLARSPLARRLEQLRIHHNRLGEPGARTLATDFPELALLDVEGTELGAAGTHALLASRSLPKLASLDLSRNALTDADFAVAVDALQLPALRHLACIENYLEHQTAAALGRSGHLANLRSLDLSGNPLGDPGVAALTGLPALDVLRLKATSITTRGIAAFAAGPLASHLHTLDLSQNRIDDEAITPLGRLSLVALDLGGSTLTAQGVSALAASPLAARLESLTLTGLEPGALDVLLAADFPELRTLVADRFDDSAADVLATARGLPSLHRIIFTARELTDDGARSLARSPHLEQVSWMELDAAKVSDIGRAELRRRFGHHAAVFAGASLHAFTALGRRI